MSLRTSKAARGGIGLVLMLGLMATALADAPPTSVGAPPGTAMAGDDAQDFVVFGESRPVLLRLHIRVNDRPFRALFKEFGDEIFKDLDKNGDGVLNKAEIEKLPNARMIFRANVYLFGFTPLRMEEVDLDKDGKVTRQELAAYFETSGASVFKLIPPSDAGEKLNEELFKKLDTDQDGKLSKEELRAAPAALLALDKDEDEMVSVQELGGSTTPNVYEPADAYPGEGQPKAARVRPTVIAVKPGDSTRRLAGELLHVYASRTESKAQGKLTRAEIALDEPTFRGLDTNNDGTLDTRELSRFTARPPDLEMNVRLEAKPGIAPFSVVKRDSSPFKGHDALEERTMTAQLGTTRFTLNAVDGVAERGPRPDYRQNYTFQFKRADKDNNGYIDKMEAQSSVFAGLFDLLDADGDGKLYEKEILAFVSRVQSLNERALASMMSLSVVAEGEGLFDLVDKNKDRRLSVREMRGFVTLLNTLDRNHDGCLDRREIPRKYTLRLQRGPGTSNNSAPGFRRFGMETAQPAPALEGPVWFQKMDRNRDGDVSRREFLGSDEQFRKIDRDGDGLISLEEAKQAEKERGK